MRQLKQMNGHASFNEVFFHGRNSCRLDAMIGKPGDGWRVAMTTLAHERRMADGLRGASRKRRHIAKAAYTMRNAPKTSALWRPYKWYPQRAGRVDLALPARA